MLLTLSNCALTKVLLPSVLGANGTDQVQFRWKVKFFFFFLSSDNGEMQACTLGNRLSPTGGRWGCFIGREGQSPWEGRHSCAAHTREHIMKVARGVSAHRPSAAILVRALCAASGHGPKLRCQPFLTRNSGLRCLVWDLCLRPLRTSETEVSALEKMVRFYFITQVLYLLPRNC